MELHEKLQELRRQRGMTQEELAQELFVSRAAVSKWESGRGYPNIDSLKAIAKFFDVTVDGLLSGDELLTIAQEDAENRVKSHRDLVFGLLDCAGVALLFLPFFGERVGDAVQGVGLLSLKGLAAYLKVGYYGVVIGMTLWGLLMLGLRGCRNSFWNRWKSGISVALNGIGAVLFVVSLQPYAATFLMIFLAIKAIMLIKWR